MDRIKASSGRAGKLVLLILGFCCLSLYVRLGFYGFVDYASLGLAVSRQAFKASAAVSAAALVLFALNGWFAWFKPRGAFAVLMAIFASAAPIICLFATTRMHFIVAVSLEGVASAALMYGWLLLMSRFEKGEIILTALLGFAASLLPSTAMAHLSSTAILVIAVFCAAVSGACATLIDPRFTALEPDGRMSKEQALQTPWHMAAIVVLCGFFSTLVLVLSRNTSWMSGWPPSASAFFVATLLVIFSTAVLIFGNKSWASLVWMPLLIVFTVVLVLACMSSRQMLQVALGALFATVFCARCLHWLIVPVLLSEMNIPRSSMSAFVLLAVNGLSGTVVGESASSLAPQSVQGVGGAAGIIAIALGVLITVVFFIYWKIAQARRDKAAAQVVPAAVVGPAEALQMSLERICAGRGLTSREEEVALLTAQGFSAAYIAERLVVSQSTVRFHQQNLYSKMGVHSRNELIELLN